MNDRVDDDAVHCVCDTDDSSRCTGPKCRSRDESPPAQFGSENVDWYADRLERTDDESPPDLPHVSDGVVKAERDDAGRTPFVEPVLLTPRQAAEAERARWVELLERHDDDTTMVLGGVHVRPEQRAALLRWCLKELAKDRVGEQAGNANQGEA